MLKVSTTSWHYRLRAKIFDTKPKDLCSYFWSTVVAAIAMVLYKVAKGIAWVFRPLGRLGKYGPTLERGAPYFFVALGIGLLLVLLGWTIWSLIYNTEDFLLWVLLVLGVIAAFAAGIVLLAVIIAGIVHSVKRWGRSRPAKPKKTRSEKPKKIEQEGDSTWTIFWAFLSAKKRKVCPLIEVVGDE